MKTVFSPLCLRRTLTLGLLALALASSAWLVPAEAASVDREFQLKAGELLNWCRRNNCKSVGVLKFRVQVGNQPISDNVGTLNMALANKLEIALILANDVRNPIDIVSDASSVIAEDKQANHLSPAGRARLFEKQYPMAWGKKSIVPDVFFTGLAKVSTDLSQMSITINGIDKKDKEFFRIGKDDIKASPTPLTLAEAGRSFLRGTRGPNFGMMKNEDEQAFLKRAETEAKQVLGSAKEVFDGKKEPILSLPELPVGLEIYYGHQLVGVRPAGGEMHVDEPGEGVPVSFKIIRRDKKSPMTYGVVLKVNGRNTLYEEQEQDLHCTRWILEQEDDMIQVQGFQIDGSKVVPFVVLSPEASKADEMNYGKDVGMITMTIFQQKPNTRIVGTPGLAAGGGKPPATPPGDAPAKPPSDPPAKPPANPPAKPADPPAKPADPPAKPAGTPPAGGNTPTAGGFPPDLPDAELSPEERANTRNISALRSIQRAALKKEKPATLGELKMQLASTPQTETRGLIVKGGAVLENAIRYVEFTPDPVPVGSIVIRYYKKGTPSP